MNTATEPCAGCGRASMDVAKMVPARLHATGAPVHLCDRCLQTAERTMADGPTRIPGIARTCAFCGKVEQQVAIIVPVGQRLICDECVADLRGL